MRDSKLDICFIEVICTKRLLLKGCFVCVCVCVCVCGRMREIGQQKVKAQLEGTLSNEIRGELKMDRPG